MDPGRSYPVPTSAWTVGVYRSMPTLSTFSSLSMASWLPGCGKDGDLGDGALVATYGGSVFFFGV